MGSSRACGLNGEGELWVNAQGCPKVKKKSQKSHGIGPGRVRQIVLQYAFPLLLRCSELKHTYSNPVGDEDEGSRTGYLLEESEEKTVTASNRPHGTRVCVTQSKTRRFIISINIAPCAHAGPDRRGEVTRGVKSHIVPSSMCHSKGNFCALLWVSG